MCLLTFCTTTDDIDKILKYIEMNSSSKQAREILFGAILENQDIFNKPNILEKLKDTPRSTLEYFNAHLNPLGLSII